METFYKSALRAFTLEEMDVPMILLGTVLIFLLYKGLERFLFRPYLEHLERRESVTTGAVETAAMMRQKSTALKARYEESLLHARIGATKDRLSRIAEAQKEAQEIIHQAEAQAAGRLAEARKKLESEIAQCRAVAENEAYALAERLATRVDSELTVH